MDALQLVQTCEKLGIGEILLNCFGKDVINSGFVIELAKLISENVTIRRSSQADWPCVTFYKDH